MILLTILGVDEQQYQCTVGSFKEAIEWCYLLEDIPTVKKFKLSDSEGSLKYHSQQFPDIKKWVEKFYEK